jgi:hypothetical protein
MHMKVTKLKTGVYVCSHRRADGTTVIKVMNQREYNRRYMFNVWWSKVKDSLSSFGIITPQPTNCKTCGTKLGIDCGAAEPDYNHEYCSVGCYQSRNLDYIN